MTFKVAERLEPYRIRIGEYASPPGNTCGAFLSVHGPCGLDLTIIASDGAITQWEHVSVSTQRRTPNWAEMSWVKDQFWSPDDCVVQFHPPAAKYVNNYSYCLHLWRWRSGEFPLPPSILVGVKELGVLK